MAKNNNHDMKRLLAGAMAFTIVAGQVILPANVGSGGMFAESAVTAKAYDDSDTERKTLSVTIPDGAVITDEDNKVIGSEDGVYALEGGKTYYIYSNEKLYPSSDDCFDDVSHSSSKKGYSIDGESYTYKCEVITYDEIENDECSFAHVHSAKVSSPADRSDQLVVNCTTENGAEDVLLAEIVTDDVVWYGTDPSAFEIYTNGNAYGVSAECIDCYYSARDAINGNAIDPADMVVGGEYRLNANIRVYYEDGSSTEMIIRRDIEFNARPIWECDFFYRDQQLWKDEDGVFVIPADMTEMVYNGEEQSIGDITVRNNATGEELVIGSDCYIRDDDGQTSAKNAGWYGFTVEGIDNYCESSRIAWEIGKAYADVSAEPKQGIVFDGQPLDLSDFILTANNDVDFIKDGAVEIVDDTWFDSNVFHYVYPDEPGEDGEWYGPEEWGIQDAGDHWVNIRISSQNYEDIYIYDLPVTIERRNVTVTPHIEGPIVYGNWTPELWTERIEEAEVDEYGNVIGTTGIIPGDWYCDAWFGIDADIDWSQPMPAGEYDIVVYDGSLENGNYNAVLDENANKLIVEPKDLNSDDIFLTYEWCEPWDRPEEGGPAYGYDSGMKTAKVCYDNPDVWSTELNKGTDFTIVSGSLRKAAVGDYNVTIKGNGNYTGTRTLTWGIYTSDAPIDANCLYIENFDEWWDEGEERNRFAKDYDGKEINIYLKDWVDDNYADSVTSIETVFRNAETGDEIDGTPKNVGYYNAVVTLKSDCYNDITVEVPFEIRHRWVDFYRNYTLAPGAELPVLTENDVEYFNGIADGDKELFANAINEGKMTYVWNEDNWASVEIEDGYTELSNYEIGASASLMYKTKSLRSSDIEVKIESFDNIVVFDNGKEIDPEEYSYSVDPTETPGEFEVEISGNGGKYRGVKTVKFTLYTVKEKDTVVRVNPSNQRLYVGTGFTMSITEGFTLKDYGILYCNDGKITEISQLTLDNTSESIKKTAKTSTNLLDIGKGVTAVGYVVIEDANGNEMVAYTNDIGGKTAVITEKTPVARENAGNKYIGVSYFATVADGWTPEEYGILYCNDGTITDASQLTIGSTSASVKRVVKTSTNLLDNGNGVVAVGYVAVKNSAGDVAYVYTDNIGGSFEELTK